MENSRRLLTAAPEEVEMAKVTEYWLTSDPVAPFVFVEVGPWPWEARDEE